MSTKFRILSLLSIVLLFSCSEKKETKVRSAEVNVQKEEAPHSGEIDNPSLKKVETNKVVTSNNISTFIREGYYILDTTSGDLNRDAYPDMMLALKKNDEESSSSAENPEKRPLLILLGDAEGNYRLAAKNDNAIYCVDCGGMMGDPFTGIAVKNGYFSLEHEGGSAWRWTRIITFRYSEADQNWLLHRDGGDHFHVNEPEAAETKIKTKKDFGKVLFEEFDVY